MDLSNSTRLLDALLKQHPDTAKARAKQWILAGRVSLNGVVVRKPHQPVGADDKVELGSRNITTLDCGSGWQIHPRVALLYLDSSIAVVNKGPGLISVPSMEGELCALNILADFLCGKLKARDRGVAGKSLPPVYRRLQPLPVHRLDQYTSGVFCMATNPTARHHLIEQLKVRTMKREYVAFVEGRSSSPKGTWRNWLQLSPDELRQQVLSPADARNRADTATEAITHFEVIAERPLPDGRGFITKLRLRLETGRKHQIRAQAAYAGLPLVGDRTYNPAWRKPALPESAIDFPRQALHAAILSLEHPERPGVRMSWTAELPKDLRRLESLVQTGRL